MFLTGFPVTIAYFIAYIFTGVQVDEVDILAPFTLAAKGAPVPVFTIGITRYIVLTGLKYGYVVHW